MIRTTTLSLLLLALAAPAAFAEEAAMTLEDDDLDAMPPAANAYADIIGGSIVLDGETLVTTLRLAFLPAMQPGTAYAVLFSDGEQEWYAAAFTAPDLQYAYGLWGGDDDGPSGFEEAKGSHTVGAEAEVRVEIPARAFREASVLSAPRALAADIKSGAPPVGILGTFLILDEASGSGEIRLSREGADAGPSGSPERIAPSGEAAPEETAQAQDPDTTMRIPAAGAIVSVAALAGALAAGALRRP